MPRRADVLLAQTAGLLQFSAAGTTYLVQTPAGVLYAVYVDTGSDLAFRKSSDGGLSWGASTIVFTGSVLSLSVWYDRWSNIAADLIHLAYTESAGGHDTLYRTIDTASSDALSTQTVIFAGVSAAVNGHLSIARAVGGNVYCKTVIDSGTEGGFFRLPNANVPNGAWDAARTVDETIATADKMILLPDYDAADTQDMLAVFWDASAAELSRKLYDDSANSWAETSIATSMTASAATATFPNFAVAMDSANTRHYLVAWSNVDTLNADLRFWTIDAGSITERTNVVQNSGDDQGVCAIHYDTVSLDLFVAYTGKSDGSETFPTSTNVYVKGSGDFGVTWGPETLLNTNGVGPHSYLATVPRGFGDAARCVLYNLDRTLDELFVNVAIVQPRATYVAGMV